MSEEKKLSETIEIPVTEFSILLDFARRFNVMQTMKHVGPLAVLMGEEFVAEMADDAGKRLLPISFEIHRMNSEELKNIGNEYMKMHAEAVQKEAEELLNKSEQQPTTEQPADKTN